MIKPSLTVKMIDPPAGWMYGFPKPIPDMVLSGGAKVIEDWFVTNGYPREKITSLGDYFHFRVFEKEINTINMKEKKETLKVKLTKVDETKEKKKDVLETIEQTLTSNLKKKIFEEDLKDDFIKSYPIPEPPVYIKNKTFGEKLVGIDLNDLSDNKVRSIKKLFAEITDILEYNIKHNEISQLHKLLYNHTLGELLNAQMNVVKVLTFKD
jgi:hypothetical protein